MIHADVKTIVVENVDARRKIVLVKTCVWNVGSGHHLK